jgi:hypothetical protein
MDSREEETDLAAGDEEEGSTATDAAATSTSCPPA